MLNVSEIIPKFGWRMEDVTKFSRDDVRRHLTELGYSNIEDSKLDEFCTDLRKLIKFEEKEKKIGEKLELLEKNQKRIDFNKENDSTSSSAEMPKRKRRIRREEKQRLKLEKLKAREERARSLSESELDSYRLPAERVDGGAVSEEAEASSLYIDVDLPPASRPGSSKSQPLAVSLVEQPPAGFIRVRSGPSVGRRPADCDPVALHQKYQAHWDKFQVPGEKRHDKLRWAVRGWMMGEEPL